VSPNKKTVGLGLLAGLFVLVFFLLPSFATLYTDWLWFVEVGHEQVFLRTLNTRLGMGIVAFAAVFGVLYLNIRLAQRELRRREFTVFGPQGPRTIALDMRKLQPLFHLGAAAVAIFVALYASGRWDTWLMARNAVPFGKVDPVLGYDISFYLFQLPLLHFLHTVAFMTVLLAALAVGLVHFAGHVPFQPRPRWRGKETDQNHTHSENHQRHRHYLWAFVRVLLGPALAIKNIEHLARHIERGQKCAKEAEVKGNL